MALILNIETSTPTCSVCLADNGQVLDMLEDKQGNSHARVLTLFINSLMSTHRLEFSQLDAVAVSAGPGSYTGLRIGTSVAKGLCYALNKPLIAVSTLQSLAGAIQQQANDPLALFMPFMDARRMDVYTALFNSRLESIIPAAMHTVNEQLELFIVEYGKVLIGGNAMFKAKEIFKSDKIEFVENIDCSSALVAQLSNNKFNENQFEDMAWFQPQYLKEFEIKK